MELIDKSAVVAEIEKRIKGVNRLINIGCSNKEEFLLESRFIEKIHTYEDILDYINTLEVKEIKEPIVDLEEEIENELERTWYGEYLDTDKFKESAVYFYELGLKAKGE